MPETGKTWLATAYSQVRGHQTLHPQPEEFYLKF